MMDIRMKQIKQSIVSHNWATKVDAMRGVPHFEILSSKKLRKLVESMKHLSIEAFETKRDVKCLFCDDNKKCEDPMNNIDFKIEEVDWTLEQMIDHPKYNELKEEAAILRKRIRFTGCEPASLMFFICKK